MTVTAVHAERTRRWLRLLAPLALVPLGVWGLAGCFYLPLPEHAASGETDFRDSLGGEKSRKPIRVGIATRQSIADLLGVAPYVSEDGHSVAYVFKTEGSVWVWPLCFNASGATLGYYSVRMQFDDRDVLREWKVGHEVFENGWVPVGRPAYPEDPIRQLNEHGSPLHPRRIETPQPASN